MLGELCALSCSASWAFAVVLFKRSEELTPQGLNLLKNVIAATLVGLTIPIMGVELGAGHSTEDLVLLAVSGVVGISLADTLFFMSLRRIGASRVAVVDCVYAPAVVLLSVLVLGEPLGAGILLGGVLVVGGVLAITATGARGPDAAGLARRDLIAGIAIGLAGILCLGLSVVVAKRPLERGDLLGDAFIRMIAGIAGQLVWIAAAKSQRGALRALAPSAAWRTAVPASVIGSYISVILWLGGFKWANASVAAVLNQMTTVFLIGFAWLHLGERIPLRTILGAAAAVAGAALVVVL